MKISPAQSDFLNWSRWVAAWLVVAEHARSLIFVDYGDLKSPGLLAKGFYFLTGFGHEAVMVFFVISGYLVGGKVWNLFRKGRFNWRRYLADRLSRLYAVLFVALLLGAILDWSGCLFFNKYGLYNQGYEGSIAVLGAAPVERMGWRDFLVNASFLQTIVGPPFGSNGPLWSLAYEWWYYILFPLVLAAVWPIVDVGRRLLMEDRRSKIGDRGEEEILTTEDTERTIEHQGRCKMEHPKVDTKGEEAGATESKEGAGSRLASQAGAEFPNPSTSELAWDSESTSLTRSASGPVLPVTNDSLIATRALSAFVCLLTLAGLCWLLTWDILILFGVWLLGLLAAIFGRREFAIRNSVFKRLILFFTIVNFGGALLVVRLEVWKWGAMDQFLIGVGFAMLLCACAVFKNRLSCHGVAHYFADFSYSVYLIHFPVLVFSLSLAYWAYGFGIRMPLGISGFAWYVGIFAFMIFISWLVSLFTERKTAVLREWLYRFLINR